MAQIHIRLLVVRGRVASDLCADIGHGVLVVQRCVLSLRSHGSCWELTKARLLIHDLKVFALELLKFVARVRTNWLPQFSEGHLLAEVQELIFVILDDPRKYGVLRRVVEAPVRDEIQIEEVVSIAEHSPLPCVLVVLHVCEQMVADIFTERLLRALRDSHGGIIFI